MPAGCQINPHPLGTEATITELALIIVAVAVGATLGAWLFWMIQGRVAASRFRDAEDRAAQIIRAAEKEAETRAREAKLEAKDLIVQAKADLDKEIQTQRAEILVLEKRLLQKEESLDRKVANCERREADLQAKDR